jgi:hypothetical protein
LTSISQQLLWAGRNVASGVHIFESLRDRRYFDGDWHYKHDEIVVDAFVNNIRNDVGCGCVSQPGARVFKKQEYDDEMGSCPLAQLTLMAGGLFT